MFLFLALLALPFQDDLTPEQIRMVSDLGHQIYLIRERATKDISKLGYEGLPLARAAIANEDPEIRMRGELIKNRYFNSPKIFNMPYIYSFYKMEDLELPSGKKFHSGEHLAKMYWRRVEGKEDFDPQALEFASKLLIYDIRSMGVSWDDIEFIIIHANARSKYELFQEMIGHPVDPEEGP